MNHQCMADPKLHACLNSLGTTVIRYVHGLMDEIWRGSPCATYRNVPISPRSPQLSKFASWAEGLKMLDLGDLGTWGHG